MRGWNQCKDLCPYKQEVTGVNWDSLYNTYCTADSPEVDRLGACKTPDDIIAGCKVMGDMIWTKLNKTAICKECSTSYLINSNIVEHRYFPNEGPFTYL